MEKDFQKRCVEELLCGNPKKVREAAAELGKVVKDEGLNKEIALVSAIAGQRKSLEDMTKKKKEIDERWSKDKIEKHRDEVSSIYNNLPLAAVELKRLESQRTMSDEELRKRLIKALG